MIYAKCVRWENEGDNVNKRLLYVIIIEGDVFH